MSYNLSVNGEDFSCSLADLRSVMISNVCVELIVKSAHYPVVYSRRLFNHLPMTLVALDEMGATKIQLKSSQQHYVQLFSITSSDDYRNPIVQQFKNFQQLYL